MACSRRSVYWWEMTEKKEKDSLLYWLWRAVKGAIIGTGAILPGISGGVLSIILGIYKPMMEFLSNPFKTLKKYFLFFLPIIVGFMLGFIAESKLLGWLFELYPIQLLWLFIALILGTFPALWREAGKRGRKSSSWVAMAVSFVIMLVFLLSMNHSMKVEITPNSFWYGVCGLFWGIGMIVPGLSPSNFLIYLGLYEPMLKGIGNIDLSVIIPIGIGFVISLVLLAKIMNYLLDNFYRTTFHVILGIVLASTIAIMPFDTMSIDSTSIISYVVCFIVGLIVASLMGLANKKFDKKN